MDAIGLAHLAGGRPTALSATAPIHNISGTRGILQTAEGDRSRDRISRSEIRRAIGARRDRPWSTPHAAESCPSAGRVPLLRSPMRRRGSGRHGAGRTVPTALTRGRDRSPWLQRSPAGTWMEQGSGTSLLGIRIRSSEGRGVSTRRGRNVHRCSIEDCDKLTGMRGTARGLCSMHYSRLIRNGDPNIRSKRVYLTYQVCTVEGCDRLIAGRGLCSTHWQQWKRRGDPCAPLLRGRPWSARDIRRLELVLDGWADGLGWARPFECVELGQILDRTARAVTSKLGELRKARRRAQTRFNSG